MRRALLELKNFTESAVSVANMTGFLCSISCGYESLMNDNKGFKVVKINCFFFQHVYFVVYIVCGVK